MINILHLETATKACSVALSVDGKIKAVKESLTEEFSHAENLTLYIEEVLNQANITLKDLHAVSISSGPGSYTGLRIGVSTAKGLCYALEIPLIAVDSLISMASLAKEKYPEANLLPAIDARRMEVFSAIYDQNMNPIKAISSDIINKDSYSEFEPFICFGDGSLKLHDIWKHRANVSFDSEIHASARGQVKIAFSKYNEKDFEDVAYFEPFYLKDFVSTKKQ